MWSTWLKDKKSCQVVIFATISQEGPTSKGPAKVFMFCFTKFLLTLYIPSLPTYYKECFLERKPRYYPWELEIVILTILYTILCGLSQLLTLHIHNLERLIAQTLTTPNLSVKWGFGAARKHWKNPIVWRMQLGWIAWSGELEKTRFCQVSW